MSRDRAAHRNSSFQQLQAAAETHLERLVTHDPGNHPALASSHWRRCKNDEQFAVIGIVLRAFSCRNMFSNLR
ncbi:hypothetical protein HBI47_205450 [Parastagonospora nodorum]|nr:hypothetical protein HBI47_205450 [Parastagonospora nodorum]